LNLRRTKRGDHLNKKRDFSNHLESISLVQPQQVEEVNKQNNGSSQLVELDDIQSIITSKDLGDDLKWIALNSIRQILIINNNDPIQKIIDLNILSYVIEALESKEAKIIFEATWILLNITTGTNEQTNKVIELGAIPLLFRLLRSNNDTIADTAIWTLGNIAGDCYEFRDYLLSNGILNITMDIIKKSKNLVLVQDATWLLSNLCRHNPPPDWKTISAALPLLNYLLYSDDHNVLVNVCWSYSYLTNTENVDQNQSIIDSGMHEKIVDLLLYPSYEIQKPAIRVVGNLVSGTEVITQLMLESSLLPCVRNLIQSPNSGIRKEACWTLSNIAAGTAYQIQEIINAEIFPIVLKLFDDTYEICKEAIYTIFNATVNGNMEQIEYLVSLQCLEKLCKMLFSPDPTLLIIILITMNHILQAGKEKGVLNFVLRVESVKGNEILEELQNHQNEEIYQKALFLLENFFSAEDNNNM